MDLSNLKDKFLQVFGSLSNNSSIYFAPGRVNLIGEHTDYNGGLVLPCSLNFGTYLVIRKNKKSTINLFSEKFPGQKSVEANGPYQTSDQNWTNYPVGILKEFSGKGLKISGLDMYFAGNIPDGAGLSSSASIEMVTAFAINDLFGFEIDILELIKISQHAENEFVGMKCGIMDQFAVGKGKKDHALFLNCETLDNEMVPVNLKDYRLLIINTNKKRELATSKYNERRKECEDALEILRMDYEIQNLSRILPDNLEEYLGKLTSPYQKKRVRHIVTENRRVKQFVEALKNNQIEKTGTLMYDSHFSLRVDYEVSCNELDVLVDLASKKGFLGARMTGGGFGGCTVNFIHKEQLEENLDGLLNQYFKKTGMKATVYLPEIGSKPAKFDG
ncbi:MAG: galactokinase [Bacteroidales bacterium]|nr:galactokinase [Bacteroidales bacterium]